MLYFYTPRSAGLDIQQMLPTLRNLYWCRTFESSYNIGDTHRRDRVALLIEQVDYEISTALVLHVYDGKPTL